MKPSPTVRLATLADAQAIAETHVASWQVAYRGFYPDDVLDQLSVADRRALWEPRLASGKHTIWVTEDKGRIAGFLAACPSRDPDLPAPGVAEIAALYVRPDYWGQGCGHALCQAAFAHMRETPAQTVIVWALSANSAARHFYESIGFAADDARKDITLFGVTLPEMRFRQSLR